MSELTTSDDTHSIGAEHATATFDEVVLPHLPAAYRLAARSTAGTCME